MQHTTYTYFLVFRLDALALSVIATATWLAGWLAVVHEPDHNLVPPVGAKSTNVFLKGIYP